MCVLYVKFNLVHQELILLPNQRNVIREGQQRLTLSTVMLKRNIQGQLNIENVKSTCN